MQGLKSLGSEMRIKEADRPSSLDVSEMEKFLLGELAEKKAINGMKMPAFEGQYDVVRFTVSFSI